MYTRERELEKKVEFFKVLNLKILKVKLQQIEFNSFKFEKLNSNIVYEPVFLVLRVGVTS